MNANRELWSYNQSTRTLLNLATNQTVQYCGPKLDLDWTKAEFKRYTDAFLFLYKDDDLEFPVIRWNSKVPALCYFDYNTSLQVWNHENSTHEPVLPYGIWRRLDQCLIDAFLCWPKSDEEVTARYWLCSRGGWLNGQWEPSLEREFSAGLDHDLLLKHRPVETALPSLAIQSPAPWIFCSVEAGCTAKLNGIVETENFPPYLPASSALSGFERSISHLKRADGTAVMFPSAVQVSTSPGERQCFESAYITYADKNLFFDIVCTTRENSWIFTVPENLRTTKNFGVRHSPKTGYLIDSQLLQFLWEYRDQLLFSPGFVHEFTQSLVDGWLSWKGSQHHLHQDPDRLEALVASGATDVPELERSGLLLMQRQSVRITGRYVGGIFRRAHTNARIVDSHGYSKV
jgi:hypothetical protein